MNYDIDNRTTITAATLCFHLETEQDVETFNATITDTLHQLREDNGLSHPPFDIKREVASLEKLDDGSYHLRNMYGDRVETPRDLPLSVSIYSYDPENIGWNL